MKQHWYRRVAVGVLTAIAALVLAGPASAGTAKPWKVYVSGGAACGHPSVSSINAGIAAVHRGGTVVVCRGFYNEDAVVTKPLTLVGHGARINPSSPVLQTNSPLYAAGAGNNGITVMARWVTVRGFKVSHATGDGILSAANHTRIIGNRSNRNAATGISLNGSSWSLVKHNVVNRNTGGGVTLANDVGAFVPGATASHDRVVGNIARNNTEGCGVIVVDHLGSTVSGNPGTFDNVIRGNLLVRNGPTGGGAGIVIASPVPGGSVQDNLVIGNRIRGSGLAGVTVHSHVPGQHFAGNRIIGNDIGRNNVAGDYGDPHTTGVFVGSIDPLKIVVRRNLIHNNHFGVFTAGAVKVRGLHHNTFVHVAHRYGSTPGYAG